MLSLSNVHRCVYLKFLLDGVGPRIVIVNNLAREQFNQANPMWTPCGCHSYGVYGGSYAVLLICTCVVQLRLHIFYFLLKLLVFGSDNSGGGHVIFVLHTYVGKLSLYVIEFCL